MEKSEQIDQLAIALVKAQAIIQPAIKDKDNPFFRSKYADLTGIWDVIREPLTKNGLCLIQLGEEADAGTVAIRTMLLHTSGQWVSGVMKAKLVKDDPQAYGSGTTYLKRYGAAAIVGVITEDDDGAAASGTIAKKDVVFKESPPIMGGSASAVANRYKT